MEDIKQQNKSIYSRNILLSIVIPSFNEGKNIFKVANDSTKFLNKSILKEKYEIIIVDDGSFDNTREITKKITSCYPCINVVYHENNLGFGAALKTGYSKSTGEYLTFIPADGEVKIDQVIKLYNEIEDADIIVSSRKGSIQLGHRTVRSIPRKILTYGLRYMLKICLRFDPVGMEGIYIVRKSIIKNMKMVAETGLLHQEIIMRCHRDGYKIKKSFIEFNKRLSGKSKVTNFRTIARTIVEMIKIRFTNS